MKTKEDLRKEQTSACLEFVTTELSDIGKGLTKLKDPKTGRLVGLVDSCTGEVILDEEDESTVPQLFGVEMSVAEAIQIFRELEIPIYEDDPFSGGQLAVN